MTETVTTKKAGNMNLNKVIEYLKDVYVSKIELATKLGNMDSIVEDAKTLKGICDTENGIGNLETLFEENVSTSDIDFDEDEDEDEYDVEAERVYLNFLEKFRNGDE